MSVTSPPNGLPPLPISGSGDPLFGETILPSKPAITSPDLEVTLPDVRSGSFATTLVNSALDSKMRMRIPSGFLKGGTRGKVLQLQPVQHLQNKEMMELYFKAADTFTFGRSPLEVDWITCFFPRNEKNDLRSRRISKIHARLELKQNKIWVNRTGAGVVHLGPHELEIEKGGVLKEDDEIRLAEDYTLKVQFDASLRNTLCFENGHEWQMGQLEFEPSTIGAIRFDPVNSGLGLRNSCWLFVDVGFGRARGGVLTAGHELAPQQGVFLRMGGCFWVINLVENGKVMVNEATLGAFEAVPLTLGDTVWLGAIRYTVYIC